MYETFHVRLIKLMLFFTVRGDFIIFFLFVVWMCVSLFLCEKIKASLKAKNFIIAVLAFKSPWTHLWHLIQVLNNLKVVEMMFALGNIWLKSLAWASTLHQFWAENCEAVVTKLWMMVKSFWRHCYCKIIWWYILCFF